MVFACIADGAVAFFASGAVGANAQRPINAAKETKAAMVSKATSMVVTPLALGLVALIVRAPPAIAVGRIAQIIEGTFHATVPTDVVSNLNGRKAGCGW